MDQNTFRELSARLGLAYARCFETLSWENEGGKPH